MFGLEGILASVFAGLQGVFANGILSFITSLLGGVLPNLFPPA
jgi:hypothetical protein